MKKLVSYIKWRIQKFYSIAYLTIRFHQINHILQILFCQCQSKMIHQSFAYFLHQFCFPHPFRDKTTESLHKAILGYAYISSECNERKRHPQITFIKCINSNPNLLQGMEIYIYEPLATSNAIIDYHNQSNNSIYLN